MSGYIASFRGSRLLLQGDLGSPAATGFQGQSASFSIDDSIVVSVALADALEDSADGGAETMDDRRELQLAHDMAWSAVAPARQDGGKRRALFHVSERRSDGQHSELGTALLARQLAFAALTEGKKDHADPFVFGKSDEIDEQERFQKSFDGLFDLSIDFATVSGKRSRPLHK